MKLNWFVVPALALSLGVGNVAAASAPQGPRSNYYGQEHDGWDAPPQEFREVQRQGFHDGIEGARRDVENHRRLDVNNRDEYRHPQVRRRDRDAYREGFRRGYAASVSHFSNDHHDWDHDHH